jgi:hypothetical protein
VHGIVLTLYSRLRRGRDRCRANECENWAAMRELGAKHNRSAMQRVERTSTGRPLGSYLSALPLCHGPVRVRGLVLPAAW